MKVPIEEIRKKAKFDAPLEVMYLSDGGFDEQSMRLCGGYQVLAAMHCINTHQAMLEALASLLCCPAFNGEVFKKDPYSHRLWTLAREAFKDAVHIEVEDEEEELQQEDIVKTGIEKMYFVKIYVAPTKKQGVQLAELDGEICGLEFDKGSFDWVNCINLKDGYDVEEEATADLERVVKWLKGEGIEVEY